MFRNLLAGTLGMILGPVCQRNSWSGVRDGGICLQSTYRFKVWGSACWCDLTAGFGERGGSRVSWKMDLHIRIGSLPAGKCAGLRGQGPACRMHPRVKSGGLLAGKDPQL